MTDIDALEALAKAPDLWQYRSKHYPEDWEISHGEPTHVSDRDYEKRSLSAIDPAAILALIAEVRALRKSLQQIGAIENKTVGGDWDEIEEARQIAQCALGGDAAKEQP